MNFKIGDKVEIVKLSQKSVEKSLQYRGSSPLIRCPCEMKRKALKIESLFENDSLALLSFNDSLTLAYIKDLKLIP